MGGQQYVAIDLETTGLDTENDAVIEVGAVRFDQDGVLDGFQTLVNPRRLIPHVVQDLTGISEEAVARAPVLEAVAGELQAFLGDRPLVGHNVTGFDVLFLDRAGIVHSPALFDTADLASLLMPGLAEYSLSALASHFEIGLDNAHRAPADAEASARLFLGLLERARRLAGDVLSQVAEWLRPTVYPWREFFALAVEGTTVSARGSQFRLQAPEQAPALAPVKGAPHVPPERSAQVLASAAHQPEALPHFEERAEQREMALAVASAIGEGKRLIVEAGTGTGKSLAYLIPAACQAMANGQRVVVSTATINLQEQLMGKDIPALKSLLAGKGKGERGKEEGGSGQGEAPNYGDGEKGLRACQLKGRRNYLCLRQFEALRGQFMLSDAEALIASRILIWLCQTETGDRAELRMSKEEDATWRRLSADNVSCTADTSPYVVDGTCFLRRARRAAESSHIVVVNHALLLSDTANAGNVLPPYEHLIIDEAHHLEDEATRQFGFAGSERALTELLERCESVPRSVQEVLRHATSALAPYDELASVLREVREAGGAGKTRLRSFGQACGDFMSQHSSENGDYEQRLHVTRGTRAQPDWAGVEIAWENLKLLLGQAAAALEKLMGALSGEGFAFLNRELVLAEVSALAVDVRGYTTGLAAAIEQEDPSRVVWFELERTDGGVLVSWVPLSVDGLLKENLYDDHESVVLTGATLSSGGGFEYIQERLGLEDADTLALGSPFDFKQAALLLLASDMPEPNWPEYHEALSQAVVDLAGASQGRALVLFTSHSSLRAVHADVSEPLRREGIAVLGQGIDGTPRQMVRALQARPDTVLLGTASFWEGVDLAGDALSLLVIAKLPFGVPTEPVTAARSALYDDPFAQYTVPQAVLRFKQGFGRLIRRRTDRGVVVVLDRRILSKKYGSVFTESLPPCTTRQALLREMPGLVEGWLGEDRK